MIIPPHPWYALSGVLLYASTVTGVTLADERTADPGCFADVVPLAALPTQPPPVLCDPLASGPGTARAGANRWRDGFEHGLSFADFGGTGYRVFESVDGVYRSRHWRHADHWMVDIAPDAPGARWPTAAGGALLRPERAFRFADGRLVVEADFAAGHQDYADLAAWGEIVVTTAPAPGGYRRGGIYGYEMFPGHHTLGCRLQADRHLICSLMNNTRASALDGGRTWEMSFFQHVGRRVFGGGPWGAGGEAFRTCAADDVPDVDCRDRFRMRLGRRAVAIDVNGVRYFSQSGIPALPDALLDGDVYVYLASIVGRSGADVVRFHWDGVAVNASAP